VFSFKFRQTLQAGVPEKMFESMELIMKTPSVFLNQRSTQPNVINNTGCCQALSDKVLRAASTLCQTKD
jgi:hypothetical protein